MLVKIFLNMNIAWCGKKRAALTQQDLTVHCQHLCAYVPFRDSGGQAGCVGGSWTCSCPVWMPGFCKPYKYIVDGGVRDWSLPMQMSSVCPSRSALTLAHLILRSGRLTSVDSPDRSGWVWLKGNIGRRQWVEGGDRNQSVYSLDHSLEGCWRLAVSCGGLGPLKVAFLTTFLLSGFG